MTSSIADRCCQVEISVNFVTHAMGRAYWSNGSPIGICSVTRLGLAILAARGEGVCVAECIIGSLHVPHWIQQLVGMSRVGDDQAPRGAPWSHYRVGWRDPCFFMFLFAAAAHQALNPSFYSLHHNGSLEYVCWMSNSMRKWLNEKRVRKMFPHKCSDGFNMPHIVWNLFSFRQYEQNYSSISVMYVVSQPCAFPRWSLITVELKGSNFISSFRQN